MATSYLGGILSRGTPERRRAGGVPAGAVEEDWGWVGDGAELVDAAAAPPRPNRGALPGFFLFRFVTGRETLFEDFYRLLPGEQVCWDERGLTRVQRQTFASLRLPDPVGADGVE